MKVSLLLPAALAISLGLPLGQSAADAGDGPTVVELFTSQGCYSCPPAEALLGELADQDGVLALEFHVDYWDELVYGSAGKWKDVFSSPAYTQRQRAYNVALRGRGSVYTPQMIIDGRAETVGSRRRAVQKAINVAARVANPAMVSVTARQDGGYDVSVQGRSAWPAAVWLVVFDEETVTRVTAGENKGKTLPSHHVVRNLARLGDWNGEAASFQVPAGSRQEGQGCAILIQDDQAGPILGAASCPDALS